MNFQIKISEYAKNDLEIAFDFYEKQATNLGKIFFDYIISEIELLSFYGCLHQKTFGYHRMISKKFPFAIYYDCNKEQKYITIVAILDLRQNPKTIEKYLIKDRK
ncbi:type II toxin-antitoxin system RelE/ParE family toxin [Caminibacter pacificus]